MRQNEFLRFALVLSDGQGQTFNKNLEKIVTLILFNHYGTYISCAEIAKNAEVTYGLTFLPSEIEKAIASSRKQVFLEKNDKEQGFLYTIRPNVYDKLKKTDDDNKLKDIVSRFFAQGDISVELEESSFAELIQKHIYNTFNSDISTVLSLMNVNCNEEREAVRHGYTDEERHAINAFLAWDDQEKNKVLYNIISSCFEFCMMTVKKDNNSFSTIFRGKEFYLDTNIIFRLAGFNNDDRKHVMSSFIKKCKECGIKLKYTNFTQKEIEEFLKKQVNMLKALLAEKAPVNVESARLLCGKNASMDFYSLYVDWINENQNHTGDYRGFHAYLTKKIQKILNEFEFESFESFDSRYREKSFSDICEEYKKFKIDNSKTVYDVSIKIDIENYLYIREIESKAKHNSFVDKNTYFITADHVLIEWADSKMPGMIPSFVLPSVWYSIILKYHGRTNDDYSAFCQFLKVQEKSRDEDPTDIEIRRKMLACVLRLDESPKIKEDIIFDIDQRLMYDDAESIDDIPEYVEVSKQNVMQAYIDDAVTKHNESHESIISEMEKNHRKEMDEQHEKGVREGAKAERESIIITRVNKIIKRNKKIRVVFKVLLAIISAAILMNAGLYIIGISSAKIDFLPDWVAEKEGGFALASCVIPILGYTLKNTINNKFFSVSEEDVRKKVEKQLFK